MAWYKNDMTVSSEPFSLGGLGLGGNEGDLNGYSAGWGMGKWPPAPAYVIQAQQGEQNARIQALEQWQMQATLEISELKEQVKLLKGLLEVQNQENGHCDLLVPPLRANDKPLVSLSTLPAADRVVRKLSADEVCQLNGGGPPPELPLLRAATEPPAEKPPAPPPAASLVRSKSGESLGLASSLQGQLHEQLIKEGPDSPAMTRMTWRIDNVRAKLKSCAGKALVSPPFEAFGMPDMRLMVFPLGEPSRGSSKTREQKTRYESMLASGPLHCALRLKVVSAGKNSVLTFTLFVGNISRGPLVHDFAEHIVHGSDDFKINWLDQVDESTGSLTVGVELRELRSKSQGDSECTPLPPAPPGL